jgi:hypothetical protein
MNETLNTILEPIFITLAIIMNIAVIGGLGYLFVTMTDMPQKVRAMIRKDWKP